MGQVKSWDWRQHQGNYCAGRIWVVYSGDLIRLLGFLGLARKGLQWDPLVWTSSALLTWARQE